MNLVIHSCILPLNMVHTASAFWQFMAILNWNGGKRGHGHGLILVHVKL